MPECVIQNIETFQYHRKFSIEELKMKKTVIILLIVWLIIPLSISGAADMTLITEELPPFNYKENGTLTGASTEVVREIARRLGVNADVEVMPWARGYQELVGKPNVALFTTARTKDREALFHWVGPLYVSRLAFYGRKKDSPRIDSLDAARRVKAIATYKDDFGEQILKSLGFTNLDSSNSPHSNIRKLMSGRVDLWFFHDISLDRLTRETGIDPDEIEVVYTHREVYSYIAISKQTPVAVVQQWQAALDAMKADGTFWWLTRKWLPADAILADGDQTRSEARFSLQIYTEDSPPSSFMKKGRLAGVAVEIVQEILRRIGKPDTIAMVPWARGYNAALSDANTALFSTTRLPQREDLFAWVGPLYHQRWGFYRWNGSGIIAPDMDAARKVDRIGTYRKDAKRQFLQAKGFDNLVSTNKNITNILHLKQRDIDLWVSSDFNLAHLARQAGVPPESLELAFPFHTVRNYIAFSKTTSPHVTRLWQLVLDEMKADGSYQQICRKYDYTPE
jgi:polar amino acid transport system substrate-binding protein